MRGGARRGEGRCRVGRGFLRTLVAVATLAALGTGGLAGTAAGAPVVTGRGLQREFVWHTGDASVRRLPESGLFRLEQAIRPSCVGNQIPGQSPHFCTTNPATPTPANRPTALVLVR